MTDAQQAMTPTGLFLVPTLRLEVDEQGGLANSAQPLLGVLPDGTVIVEVYTSPARLVAARGDAQPWAAFRPRDLAVFLDGQDVDGLVVDLGSPDGYVLTPDGDRTPLPVSSVSDQPESDKEVPDATGHLG